MRYETYEEEVAADGSVVLRGIEPLGKEATLNGQSAHFSYTTKVALQSRADRALTLCRRRSCTTLSTCSDRLCVPRGGRSLPARSPAT